MKSDLRFICEMFLPSLLGAVYLVAWCGFASTVGIRTGLTMDDYSAGLPTLAWLLGGTAILSVIYATAMEVALDLGLKAHSWMLVLFSEMLGLAAGLFFDLVVFRQDTTFNHDNGLEMVGMLTGLTVGLIIKVVFSSPPVARLPMEI